jgi:hypothetical protein
MPDLRAGVEFLFHPATTYDDAVVRHRATVTRAQIPHDRMLAVGRGD